LSTLNSEALSQLLDLGDGVPKFIQSNVKMALLLFEFISLFIVKSNIVINAVNGSTQDEGSVEQRRTSPGNDEASHSCSALVGD